jgi:hypothetical protein
MQGSHWFSSSVRFIGSPERGGLPGEQKGWLRFTAFILNLQRLVCQLLEQKRHIAQRTARYVVIC